VLRFVIKAKRPFEYDSRLKPLADRYEGAYGFPSLESYMAVVVYGFIVWRLRSGVLALLFLPLTAFIGATRVYACSRFVHQVVGSWVLGAVGLQLSLAWLQEMSTSFEPPPGMHAVLITVLVLGFACYVSYHAEANESYILRVPKSEYTRVLSEILNQDLVQATGLVGDDLEEVTVGQETSVRVRRRRSARRDSFSFLEEVVARRKYQGYAADFGPTETAPPTEGSGRDA
jgi:hypothetical protein